MERDDQFTFYMDDAELILMDGEKPFAASDNLAKAANIMGLTEDGLDALIGFINELKDNLRHDLIDLYRKQV